MAAYKAAPSDAVVMPVPALIRAVRLLVKGMLVLEIEVWTAFLR